MLHLSEELFQQALPEARSQDIELFHSSIVSAMEEFEINTPLRMAAFLAQIAHESGNLRFIRENLNYSAEGLLRTWPRHFPTREIANRYARNPEAIANRAYANRMGNGPESSGDGWRYRGRGLIQLTGKNNYIACGEGIDYDLVTDPSYLETPEGAARSAGWFWQTNQLNSLADIGNIRAITQRINGGFNGLDDRINKYEQSLLVLDT